MPTTKHLLAEIRRLKKGKIRDLVEARMREFSEYAAKENKDLFKELCFCITTANCAAERCIKIQNAIGVGFLTLPEKELAARLKELGYRFHNRSAYLTEARKHKDSLKGYMETHQDVKELRDFLVKNVKGLGYKEASHFLRNIGYTDLAIIDFHIIDVLVEHGLIEKPKTLTKKKYLEIEGILRDLGKKAGLNLAELDLCLWYLETGKVLK